MRARWIATLLLAGCAASPGPSPDPPSSPPPVAAPKPAPSTSAVDPKPLFVPTFEALRDGDWPKLEARVGAPIAYERSASIGEAKPEKRSVAPAEAQAWLEGLKASWAPSCADKPDPPCKSLNPLSLGVPGDGAPQLTCAEGCCRHEPALLHNTPFLKELCFDPQGKLTKVVLVDG